MQSHRAICAYKYYSLNVFSPILTLEHRTTERKGFRQFDSLILCKTWAIIILCINMAVLSRDWILSIENDYFDNGVLPPGRKPLPVFYTLMTTFCDCFWASGTVAIFLLLDIIFLLLNIIFLLLNIIFLLLNIIVTRGPPRTSLVVSWGPLATSLYNVMLV